MRGKAFNHRFFIHKYRITPAYAGKSKLLEVEMTSIQDHPRLCGEKNGKLEREIDG